jgi:hypothetical protein
MMAPVLTNSTVMAFILPKEFTVRNAPKPLYTGIVIKVSGFLFRNLKANSQSKSSEEIMGLRMCKRN